MDVLFDWRNSPHVRAASINDQEVNRKRHESWFESLSNDVHTKCFIFESREERLGFIRFVDISAKHETAHWGFYLGTADHPKGLGSVLGYFGLCCAFEHLGLRKISGEVLAGNVRSIRIHNKLGFSQEGRFRAHVKKRSDYEDILLFAAFRDEWLSLHQQRIRQRLFDSHPRAAEMRFDMRDSK